MKYKSGYKYQLYSDEYIQTNIKHQHGAETEYLKLHPNGELLIRHGYCWDGPSGPTMDTKNSMRASLIHDALYQLIRLDLIDPTFRKHADYLLERTLEEDGMGWTRRKLWLNALRLFGAPAADPRNAKVIHSAP